MPGGRALLDGNRDNLNADSVVLTAGAVVGITGDYDNNGQVEQSDLDLVLLNWGNSSAVSAQAAVPEPSTLVLALLTCCGLALSIRKRRR